MNRTPDMIRRTDEVRGMQSLVKTATTEGLRQLRLSLPPYGKATPLEETLWNMAADEELRRRQARRAALSLR